LVSELLVSERPVSQGVDCELADGFAIRRLALESSSANDPE